MRAEKSPETMTGSSQFKQPMSRKTLIVVAFLAASLVGGFAMKVISDRSKVDNSKDKKIAVTVDVAKIQEVPIEIRSIGNVVPYSVVNVVPQVGGQLTKVFFTQGDFVRKGQLLFQIDPRPYQAAVEQARGNVARDVAQVAAATATMRKNITMIGSAEAVIAKDQAAEDFAKREKKRFDELVKQGAVSHQQADQMATNALTAAATLESDRKMHENAREVTQVDKANIDVLRGTLRADQAVLHNAEIQLGWTTIRSSIDGRTGSLNIHEGNVVTANSVTPLVTIDQVQPIYISFTLPEQHLDQIRRCMANGTLNVKALIGGEQAATVMEKVTFLERNVNTAAGTITLRATAMNFDKKLFPGQFLDVIATMPPDGQTVVVPESAVQPSQNGNAVYVLKADNTVEFRPVELKRSFAGMAALGKGVAPGELVVTDGHMQLTPGASVLVQSRTAARGN